MTPYPVSLKGVTFGSKTDVPSSPVRADAQGSEIVSPGKPSRKCFRSCP